LFWVIETIELIQNYKDTHRKKTRKIGFADIRFGGSATAFQPLKFQHKKAYFRGKRQGSRLSWRDSFFSDAKISLFVRLRTFVASGVFWLLFFAVDHIYRINMEQL
jgi:hypothetical protein